jgi:hypothetical protein
LSLHAKTKVVNVSRVWKKICQKKSQILKKNWGKNCLNQDLDVASKEN